MNEVILFCDRPIESVYAHYVIYVLSLYVILEMIYVALKMDGGDKLCRVCKYLAAFTYSLVVFALAWYRQASWAHFLGMCAVALYVWPVMIYRWRGDYRNRVNDQ